MSLLFITSCISYKPQTAKDTSTVNISAQDAIHTFFIAGGIGNGDVVENSEINTLLSSYLSKADKNSTLLYAGDYITSDDENKKINVDRLAAALDAAKDFKGKTRFIPGDNEWASFDSKQIEWVENYIKDRDIKRTKVEPNNVCPLEFKEVGDDLAVLYVDSQWYISNWDRVEDINRKCEAIATRRVFIAELEGYIKDARGKNLVIVMHHPIFTNGMYGLSYMGGVSPKKIFFDRYNDLRVNVSALTQDLNRVTIVSGHEKSLQYLKGGDIHQIISGSMGVAAPTKRTKDNIIATGGELEYEGKYTHGAQGFAMLKYYKDGSSQVSFITKDGEKTLALTNAFPPATTVFPALSNATGTKKVPVVTDEQKLNKTGFYNFIWGKRYREYFGIPVTAEVADLSKVYKGLKITKAGGGHQSYSARLADEDGREYAMRGLEKNALKFLKFKVPGISYAKEDYEGTFAETAVYDFFTTTHPYMQLVINPLAEAVNLNHGNTSLYYLPKQPGFEILGDAYGDQLYFIEERPNDEQKDYPGYNRMNPGGGEIKEFESTKDVFEKIKEDEKYAIDQKAFIRARIFDMLIGDWDRHEDQWRWGQYEINEDDIRFLPVPRDRDGAFAKFDGVAIPAIQLFLPDTRFWQSYDQEIPNVKWFNGEGNNLDRSILNKFSTAEWIAQAKYIQDNMSDEAIEKAFEKLPKEVQDEASENIKKNLKGRLANLDKIAERYGTYLNKTVAIHGTNKDDKIKITRLDNGMTKVVLERKLKGENEVFFDRTFDAKETKEIWIYGLDDDDEFEVEGNGDNKIMVRLIGGYGKDNFNIKNRAKVKVYDWKHEETKFEDKTPSHQFTNKYETNTFHWRYFKENNNILLPSLGFKTDDGLFLGLKDTYTNYGFNGNPFRYQHSLTANYYFDYQAIELMYGGEFANIVPNWNLVLGGYFTNDSFANNFFGYGNETVYDGNADDEDREFNRARMQQIKANVGVAHKFFSFNGLFESFRVDEDPTRFFTPQNVNNQVFETQNYIGAEAKFEYKNQNAADFPTKARLLGVTIGAKSNLDETDNAFAYASAKIGWQEKLIPSGDLVLATNAEFKHNFGDFGDDYFFYHAPSLGGDNGLRGFRNERFAGNTYFYQSTDLKARLLRVVTAAAPITFGAYGGFDYGRVWAEGENSDVWHNSYGGGIWLSTLNSLALNAGYFASEEDAIIQVGFGFAF
ncbi:hypothetical protein ULMS_16120 [Patiriisocius marinistellae]|uniref:Haemolysin activator HlyB C-terminal domain-containing protein n=2 Tax=Patiriisocius marinistellae TaxID=2494560 RepID=A0A5J4FY48_9FLAO|nr:hypothetical protein ULMS_16120 [Patiriisocius marinistellae]